MGNLVVDILIRFLMHLRRVGIKVVMYVAEVVVAEVGLVYRQLMQSLVVELVVELAIKVLL